MAERLTGVRLAPYTTLGIGGPARAFVRAGTEDELAEVVAAADRAAEPVLVLGGGSNLVLSDTGFDGLAVQVASAGVVVRAGRDGGLLVTAQAGEEWDGLVERCVASGWAGVECLSGIPGRVGATPIQNVGAYGQDVAQTIVAVRVFDRLAGQVVELPAAACGFGYRGSHFKRNPGRYLVLSVTFRFQASSRSAPVAYQELAALLGVRVGDRVPVAEVRVAVLELRRGKGMVLHPDDPDSRSVGSFFTNPVLTSTEAAELDRRAPGFPRWPLPDGRVKVPAAWLIEQAGFVKGYQKGPVRISTKHSLALTNPTGVAGSADLLALAREVRDGVVARFGVTLVNEPVLVGVRL